MADKQLTVNVWRDGQDINLTIPGDDKFILTPKRGSAPHRYLDEVLREHERQ